MGAAILGIVSGALGSFAVLRGQSLLGDAMSHAALPGVVLTFMLTGLKTPAVLMIGAAIACTGGLLLILAVTRNTRIKEDSCAGYYALRLLRFWCAAALASAAQPRCSPGGAEQVSLWPGRDLVDQ